MDISMELMLMASLFGRFLDLSQNLFRGSWKLSFIAELPRSSISAVRTRVKVKSRCSRRWSTCYERGPTGPLGLRRSVPSNDPSIETGECTRLISRTEGAGRCGMDFFLDLTVYLFVVVLLVGYNLSEGKRYVFHDFLGRRDLTQSKTDEKKKPQHSKKSAMKHTMDGKNRKNSNRVAHTERNASGRNWEIFKTLIFNDAPLDSNSGKENVQKKTAAVQKPRRKSQVPTPVANNALAARVPETEVYKESMKKLTKQVAMDCEMVGIGDGTESMIARVSIVNKHGFCVYDKYVKPREAVQDYRTKVSGIRPHHLQNGEEFDTVQKEVADILRGRILVGHAIKHDLDVLFLSHPRKCIRDTSRFKPFRKLSMGNTPSLKKLADKLLGREIQIGEHSSVEDARAAMNLYMLYRNKWESEFYSKL